MKQFTHLHLHTEYSLLDGAARINDLFDELKRQGMTACAITDHGNMYGLLKFYAKAISNGIKPIVGCEFYAVDDRFQKSDRDNDHLVLIAKDNIGYKNLMKLNSYAFLDGMYYGKPRIDYKILEKHTEGLICLSACLGGRIQKLLLNGEYDKAKDFSIYLRDMFAEGDFYMELQNHNMPEQVRILPLQKKIADEIGIKCVATNDVHYIKKEHAKMQDIMMCVQTGTTVDSPDRMRMPSDEFYLKSYDEMLAVLPDYKEALENTNEIVDKCDVIIRSKSHYGVDEKYKLPAVENYIPYYKNDEGIDNYEFLRKITYSGLKKRYGELNETITQRAEYELDTIHRLGFVEYFLVVWDYINYCESVGISVGPGRGSGAGSIVAFSTGITKIDPLKYDLLFERFINSERVSMPDFDIDFCVDRRYEVVQYVKRKYGAENVALIITYGTMAAKNAIRDISRVMSLPLYEVEKITKLIPDKLPEGLKKPPVLRYYFGLTGKDDNAQFIIPELREFYDSRSDIREIVDMAVLVEGMPRNCGTHAAGVLIAPEPVDTYIAISKIGDEPNTQCDKKELEALGLLKMDFLGLRTLTDINKAIMYVKENHGVEIDFDKNTYDDPKVFEMIGSGDLDAVFQLESGGMKKFMMSLKPSCLEDIIAGVALYRPGPMDSIPKYIENKHFPERVTYAHPMLEDTLNVTYGCIVYQEQVMRIVQDMGGYSLGKADNIRRIMGAKDAVKMELERSKFIYGDEKEGIPGAVSKGVSEEVASGVFKEMESFASYAFNKSHAAAYAYVSYQTAYMKCYYQAEFLTAVLNNRISNIDEIKKYIIVAKEHNISILPPDINLSKTHFSTDGKSIRFGLAALKNVGINVVEEIIIERETNGKFKDLNDFVTRCSGGAINKRCMESLILTGAFDSFGKYRSQLMNVYSIAIERAVKQKKAEASGQVTMFGTMLSNDTSVSSLDYPNINEYVPDIKLQFEKEIAGVYLSGHPLDNYKDRMKTFTLNSEMLVPDEVVATEDEESQEIKYSKVTAGEMITCGGSIEDVKIMNTKSGKKMAIVTLEDLYGNIEVILFGNTYDKFRDVLIKNSLVTVKGRVSIRDGQKPTVNCDNISVWKDEEVLKHSAPPVEESENLQKLALRFDTQDSVLFLQIKNIIAEYKGKSLLYIADINTKQKFTLDTKVQIRESLLFELKSLIGAENVIVF